MISRDPEASIYRQIARDIRDKIAAGVLRPGQPLGSLPSLAHDYQVGLGTIRRVIAVLRTEGAIIVAHGQTTRVAERPDRQPVPLYLGDDFVVRMPTPEDVRVYGVAEGVPVLVVTTLGADGKPARAVYPTDRHVFVVRGKRPR